MTGEVIDRPWTLGARLTRFPKFEGAVATALIVTWALILRKVGDGDVYAYLGPFAIGIIAVYAGLMRFGRSAPPSGTSAGAARRATLPRDVLVGLVIGGIMTAGTYVAYALLVRVVPSLAGHVRDLYAAARTESAAAAIAWTCVVVVAEELLYRGLVLDALSGHVPPTAAGVLSVLAYVLVQIGSGSWVIALAALVCGAIWTVERTVLRSLVAPVLSHAIWTLVVIHIYPVTGG